MYVQPGILTALYCYTQRFIAKCTASTLCTIMKRVEVNMNASFRGFVNQYAEEKGKTMPQAYRDLMELGLAASDVEIDNFSSELQDTPEQ